MLGINTNWLPGPASGCANCIKIIDSHYWKVNYRAGGGGSSHIFVCECACWTLIFSLSLPIFVPIYHPSVGGDDNLLKIHPIYVIWVPMFVMKTHWSLSKIDISTSKGRHIPGGRHSLKYVMGMCGHIDPHFQTAYHWMTPFLFFTFCSHLKTPIFKMLSYLMALFFRNILSVKMGVMLSLNFLLFFSLLKRTEICFGSTKIRIFYREKAFHFGKKSGKITLPPQKNMPVTPLLKCPSPRCQATFSSNFKCILWCHLQSIHRTLKTEGFQLFWYCLNVAVPFFPFVTQPISFPQRDCTAVWLLTSR